MTSRTSNTPNNVSHATMNDNSSEEKNATVLSEEVRQKIMRGLKAFLRGREVDLDELAENLRHR